MAPESIAELRLYGMVKNLLSLRNSLREQDERERLNFERRYIGKRLLSDGLEAGAELISLIWIVMQIINRAQPIGQFIYVQQVVSRALGAANQFVSQLSTIDEDLANLFDYQKFMQLPLQTTGSDLVQGVPDKIDLNHVGFSYFGSEKMVLEDINLSISKGQHIAIIGENGAGKSTLVKLICGLYQPTKGQILVDGRALNSFDIASWHCQLSVLQQDFLKYYFASAFDNVRFGNVSKSVTKTSINLALDQAEARTFVDDLPYKQATLMGKWMEDNEGNHGTDLSGGQWQRLALARNFYRDGNIIILDEPTSAIDALAEGRIFKSLFSPGNKKTVITISHRLSTIKKADVIYVVKDGKIAESGTFSELSKQGSSEFRRMFKDQLKD